MVWAELTTDTGQSLILPHGPSSAFPGAQSSMVVPSLMLKENENSVLQSRLLPQQTQGAHSPRHNALTRCRVLPVHGDEQLGQALVLDLTPPSCGRAAGDRTGLVPFPGAQQARPTAHRKCVTCFLFLLLLPEGNMARSFRSTEMLPVVTHQPSGGLQAG